MTLPAPLATVVDDMRAVASEAALQVSSSVVPVYREGADAPVFVGSGVLMRAGRHHFLITAAHVLDKTGESPLIPFGEAFGAALARKPFKTRSPEGRFKDRFDFGGVLLTPDEVSALSHCHWVDAGSGVTFERSAPRGPVVYSCIGFPATKAKEILATQIARAERKHWVDMDAADAAYAKCRRTRQFHLLIRYHNKLARGPNGIGPPFRFPGMSGGGAWRVDTLASYKGTRKPLLAGIIIEKPPEYARVIIAVRIATVLGALAEHFTDVRDCLPGWLLQRLEKGAT